MLEFNWQEKNFALPVEVLIKTKEMAMTKRYDVTAKRRRYFLPENAEIEIDPQGWILMNAKEAK